jgi:hypothetical protein
MSEEACARKSVPAQSALETAIMTTTARRVYSASNVAGTTGRLKSQAAAMVSSRTRIIATTLRWAPRKSPTQV